MNSLMDVLEEVGRLDYAEFENPPRHRFFRRNRKKMKKLLQKALWTKAQDAVQTCAQEPVQPETRGAAKSGVHPRMNWGCIPLKRKILYFLVVILLAAACITAGARAISGFRQNRHREYTVLRTVNGDDSPKTIETVYYLPEIPEGYELFMDNSDNRAVFKGYVNDNINKSFKFEQRVKDGYKSYFNTEYQDFEEIYINGYYALYLDFSDDEHDSGLIVWDNGDYIFNIAGSFNKNELIELAKSVKVLE